MLFELEGTVLRASAAIKVPSVISSLQILRRSCYDADFINTLQLRRSFYVSLYCLPTSIPIHHRLRHRRHRPSVITLIFKLIFCPSLTSDPTLNWKAALQSVVNNVEISVAEFLICVCKMFYKTTGIISVTARRALIAFCILPQLF